MTPTIQIGIVFFLFLFAKYTPCTCAIPVFPLGPESLPSCSLAPSLPCFLSSCSLVPMFPCSLPLHPPARPVDLKFRGHALFSLRDGCHLLPRAFMVGRRGIAAVPVPEEFS